MTINHLTCTNHKYSSIHPRSMQPMPECYPCFIKHAKGVLKLINGNKEMQEIAMQVAGKIADGSIDLPPPVITAHFQRKLKEIAGTNDFYLEIKKNSNERALKILPKIQELIQNSNDKFKTALIASLAGNAVDFGVRPAKELLNWEEDVIKLINNNNFSDNLLEEFKTKISNAKNILYLADNTGEIIIDKLFLEMLPTEKLTVAVRGKPILNDALLDDIHLSGISKFARIIDNGSDIPGTWLPETSESFRKEFEEADLIISKGMGNFETLHNIRKNIYFLFMVKCPAVSKLTKKQIGDIVLLKN